MIIEPRMNLGQLLHAMPTDATYDDAYRLRETLLRGYPGQNTNDLPADVWRDLVNAAMNERTAP